MLITRSIYQQRLKILTKSELMKVETVSLSDLNPQVSTEIAATTTTTIAAAAAITTTAITITVVLTPSATSI